MISDGVVDVDGMIDGNIRCEQAYIRKNGTVNGDVTADSVAIYGEVFGIIKAKDVSLFEGAKLHGTILHEKIIIEDGAVVDGTLKRMENIKLDDNVGEEHVEVLKRFKLIN